MHAGHTNTRACIHAYMYAHIHTNMHTYICMYMPRCRPYLLYIFVHAWKHLRVSVCGAVCLWFLVSSICEVCYFPRVWVRVCVCVCLCGCVRTYIHTYLRTYMHTYIHIIYIHFIDMYIYIYTCTCICTHKYNIMSKDCKDTDLRIQSIVVWCWYRRFRY